jgi:murein DD-endopeptidase MepM/ murein hydrolase activator NlpD
MQGKRCALGARGESPPTPLMSLRRPTIRAAIALTALCVSVEVAPALVDGSPVARAASGTAIQGQISAGRSRASGLAGAVGAASKRLRNLNASIAALQARITRIQSELNARRTELLNLRDEVNTAQTRLGALEVQETRAARVLTSQLVNGYETDHPDLISVVLEANGFSDLLERLSFAQRIRDQDARVVGAVRGARKAVAAQAIRLGALEHRAQTLTLDVLRERDDLDRTSAGLVRQQIAVAQSRANKAGQLASVRARVVRLEHRLASLQAPPTPAGSGTGSPSPGGGSSSPSAPVSHGGFTFPMPKGSVSPPGTWSLDQGVDISAPGGTPEFAVCSGTVVLHGIGGFGPSAPVLHCDSPLSGFDYVYYGHAGPGNFVPIGSHLNAGQVISEVGSGIVGISSGPHLEIGFADAAGSPIGSQTASQMMSLLQSSFAG